MEEAVRQILPRYPNQLEYRRVDFRKRDGKKRFLELSEALYGKGGVRRMVRVAPVPSLFIEGRLQFDAIPPQFELEQCIEKALESQKNGTRMNTD
jgi:hypothetical protein